MSVLLPNLPLLLVCVLWPLCGATEYYVRPTEPTNTSCPGHPCFTLAQYINDSEHYFKSNNNTVFWLLNGIHNISAPVIVSDAHNVTIERYGMGEHFPHVVFSPSCYCMCYVRIQGACKECSAIQFYNVSMATLNGLLIVGKQYNQTSSVNGISFERNTKVALQNINVEMEQVIPCTLHQSGLVFGLILSQTNKADILNVTTTCGRVLLYNTSSVFIKNISIVHSEIYTNLTTNTIINNVTVTNSHSHGITSRYSINMRILRARISNTYSHCIRLEYVQNTSVVNANIANCSDDGIVIDKSNHTHLTNIHFLPEFKKAIYIPNSHNTSIENTSIGHCALYGIHLDTTTNTYFHNITTASSVLCSSAKNTSLTNFHVLSAHLGIDFYFSANTTILNSTFSLNTTTNGALSFVLSKDSLLDNVSLTGSMSVVNCTQITIKHINMRNSTKQHGILVYKSLNVFFNENIFTELGNSFKHITDKPAVVVLYKSSGVEFSHCQFSQNTISALKAMASKFTVLDTLTFINNTAVQGAAMILQQESVMKLLVNSSVRFIGNHATYVGGAIYVDTNTFYRYTSEGRFAPKSKCIFETDVKVTGNMFVFENNSADSGGDVVYGGQMGLATTGDGSSCLLSLKNQTNKAISAITSQPSRVCVCDDATGWPNCTTVFYTVPRQVYPGEIIYLYTVVVGQGFGTGTGSVYAQFLNTNKHGSRQNTTLENWQYTQGVSQKHCNQLTYSIRTDPASGSIVLVLSAVRMNEVTNIVSNSRVNELVKKYKEFENGLKPTFPQQLLYFPLYINISVLPCPAGFTLSKQPYECECNQQLRSLNQVRCNIQNQTFQRSGSVWIGVDGKGGVIVSKYCPFQFCEDRKVNITLDEVDVQCNWNHSGRLCGGCKPGLSLALGSNQCLSCSNSFLFLLLPMALAGIVLVFAIKVLDITVSHGFLNGLVLYFNIVHSSQPVFVPQSNTNPLAIWTAWANLDLGIETCFIDGLTAYWKTWLQFVFPLYIWCISGLIIICAKYSTRMSRLMGNNPVSVLATLFLLSYTKLLRTAILILSYSIVVYPNGTKAVWTLDGNVDYLGSQHLPLFTVAVAVLLFLCLPYTLVLLFGQWLYKCSNRHISRMMFHVKPIMDAYYGPLKDKHRYWIGLLLLSTAIIHTMQAVVPNKKTDTVILAISIMAVVLLQITSYVLGLYHNKYASAFEVTILSNLALCSLVKLYTVKTEVQSHTAMVIDNLFIAAAITQLSGLVLFQVFYVIKQILPHHFITVFVKRLTKWRQAAIDHEEDDWEVYEEAALLRRRIASEESEDGGDLERVSINTTHVPTYGT